MLRVVLVEPEGEINLGFIIRLCRNFSVEELVLVKPKVRYDSDTVVRFAAHGAEYLRRGRVLVVDDLEAALQGVEVSGCTTAIVGGPGDTLRHAVTIEEFARIARGRRAALVFGRESVGLTRDELSMCTYTVHIPANPEYPTLNLSHAVAIALYVVFTSWSSAKSIERVERTSEREEEILVRYVARAVDAAASDERQRSQMLTSLTRALKCYPLSRAEAGVLTVFFRRCAQALTSAKRKESF